MFRKTIVAIAATAAIAVAALPSTASAHKWGGFGWGVGIGLGAGFAATALYATTITPVCRVVGYEQRINAYGRVRLIPVTSCY